MKLSFPNLKEGKEEKRKRGKKKEEKEKDGWMVGFNIDVPFS